MPHYGRSLPRSLPRWMAVAAKLGVRERIAPIGNEAERPEVIATRLLRYSSQFRATRNRTQRRMARSARCDVHAVPRYGRREGCGDCEADGD